jgi:DNA modification methylase
MKKISKEEEEKKALKQEQEQINLKKYRETDIFGDTHHTIINGDARKMKKIKDEEVSLIVTSPPYFNAKEYSQWPTIDAYLEDIGKVFAECYRVLKPGRRFCLNISDIPEKGDSGVRWIPLGSLLLKEATKAGFELSDRIFWFKTPLKGFNYGSLPYPPSPLICDSIEYVYVLRKPGKSKYDHLTRDQKDASKLTRDEYGEFTKQIWSIRRVRLSNNVDGHIAPFPEEIPNRCIRLYSFVGENVLDPYGGSGTTTKMAALLKRNSYLYEINKEYVSLTKERLEQEAKNLFINPKFKYE